jgi:hypothetical protein
MSQQNGQPNGKKSDRPRPVHEIRMGRIRAAIWVNETDNGVRHNVTFARLYRDEQHDQWKDSTSFGRDDLPLIAKVADQAHNWIYQQAALARAAQNQTGGASTSPEVDPEAEPVAAGAGQEPF